MNLNSRHAIASICWAAATLGTSPRSAIGQSTSAAQSPSAPRLDLHGDPLPAGAIARLGTERFGGAGGSIAFSPDGRWAAYGLWGDSFDPPSLVALVETSSGRVLDRAPVPIHRLSAIRFTPDSARLIAAGDAAGGEAPILVWRIESDDGVELIDAPSPLRFEQNQYLRPSAIEITPDGRHLLAVSGRTICMWSLESGDLLLTRAWPEIGVFDDLSISPDGRTVALGSASAGGKGTIVLWEIGSNEAPRVIQAHTATVWVQWLPGGRLLSAGRADDEPDEGVDSRGRAVKTRIHKALIWDAATGERLKEAARFESPVHDLALSPDGRRFAALTGKEGLHILDLDGQAERRAIHFEPTTGVRSPNMMAFTPDGKRLATVGESSKVRFWDVETGERALAGPDLPDGVSGAIAFLPSGDRVATADGVGGIRLWEAATGRLLRAVPGFHESPGIASIAVSPDGRLVATGNWDSAACVVEIETGREIGRFAPTPRLPDDVLGTHGVFNLAFSPDSNRLATAYIATAGPSDRPYPAPRGGIEVWDIASGRSIGHMNAPNYAARELSFTPDGAALVAGGDESQVRVFDVATGELRFRFSTESSIGGQFSLSPDGRHFLARGPEKIVRTGLRSEPSGGESVVLWDVATGRRAREVEVNGGYLWEALLRPDGGTLVAFSNFGRSIRVIDIESGDVLVHHDVPIHIVAREFAISADGSMLATRNGDATALIWDLTGRK